MNGFKESAIGLIPNHWSITTIGDISKKVTDGAHASPKAVLDGRYMASVKDMTYNKFDFSECKEISEDDFQKLVRQGCSPDKGDLLISKDGEKCLDLIFVYDQNEQIVLLSSIAIVKLSEDQDPFFYKYFLLSRNAQYIMNKWFRSGSAIPRVVLKDFKKVPVPEITFEEQLSISTVLRQLDNKITLLKEQNETLEELAQTLFKRWFVEFEFPISAEQTAAMGKPELEGKPYKSSGGKMIESELGEIPDGWGVAPLTQIANYQNGLACQKYPVVDESQKLPVLKIRELGSGVSDNTDWATSKVDEKYLVSNSDIIFSWSGTLMVKIWDGDDCVLNQHLFKVTSDEFPNWFIYQWTIFHLKHFMAVAESKATTMGHIKRSHLEEALCLNPPKDLLTDIGVSLESLFKLFVINNQEIKSLTKLRDTLLPKLMSGELRVKN